MILILHSMIHMRMVVKIRVVYILACIFSPILLQHLYRCFIFLITSLLYVSPLIYTSKCLAQRRILSNLKSISLIYLVKISHVMRLLADYRTSTTSILPQGLFRRGLQNRELDRNALILPHLWSYKLL
jgi:hypothetical protein